MSSIPGAAPPEIIRQDFHQLDSRETLRTTWPIEEMLLLQSVQGRAHEGHGAFRGHRYPNTTCDDVTRAMRLDPTAIKAARQELIDTIADYANRALLGLHLPALLDNSHNPILGISSLRFIRVDPIDVLRGLYLGGLRDDSELRKEVEEERGIRIGGGQGYHVDYHRMRALGLNADELARGEWADQIERFRSEGLIVDADQASRPGVVYQYIRHRSGPGASDDAAIVGAGLRWNLGVAVGVFFADAIDTLEKYVPAYSDQDRELALSIQKRRPDLGVTWEDAKTLAAIAATPEDRQDEVPDSSLRHLLAIDRRVDLCPVEAHLLAVEGIATPDIGLGHERVPSGRFYAWVRERVEALGA